MTPRKSDIELTSPALLEQRRDGRAPPGNEDFEPVRENFETLRQVELRYRSIFENAIHGIYQSTPAGRFLDVNPALARMLGYDSPADMIADCTDIERDYYEIGRAACRE